MFFKIFCRELAYGDFDNVSQRPLKLQKLLGKCFSLREI